MQEKMNLTDMKQMVLMMMTKKSSIMIKEEKLKENLMRKLNNANALSPEYQEHSSMMKMSFLKKMNYRDKWD